MFPDVRLSIWRNKSKSSMFKFINAEMTKKRERSEHANILELFDIVCYVWCVSWWKLDLSKVEIDVRVLYNRISAYCAPTLCVLRTVLNPPWILRTKRGGGHPHLYHSNAFLNVFTFLKWETTNNCATLCWLTHGQGAQPREFLNLKRTIFTPF